MSQNIVCEGYSLGVDSIYTATITTIEEFKSDKITTSGKSVMFKSIKFQIVGLACPSTGFIQSPTPIIGTIVATAIPKTNGLPLLREGDSTEVVVEGTIGNTPSTLVARVYINNAGQTKVKSK